MQTRTLYALLATGLLGATGLVVAEANATSSPQEPAYKFGVTPQEQWAAPGETASYRVMAMARNETTLHLSLRAPDGATVALSSDTLLANSSGPSAAMLSIVAPANGTVVVIVDAIDEAGHHRDARAVLHVVDKRPITAENGGREDARSAKETLREAPRAPPSAVSGPIDIEKRLAALEHRLDALAAKLEAAGAQPVPPPQPKPEPTRYAVTLAAGDHDIVIPAHQNLRVYVVRDATGAFTIVPDEGTSATARMP